MPTKPPRLERHRRLYGEEREAIGRELAAWYEKGLSIRTLADATGRSYAFIHQLLTEAGVTMRGRGGNTRTKVRKW